MTFWTGFEKRAAILSKFDAQGGVAPRSPEEMAAAQAADLVTLPKTIDGANCGNCRFVKILDAKSGIGMCQNPSVMQEVSERMCCSLWDSPGTIRNFDMVEPAPTPGELQGQQAEHDQMAGELQQDVDQTAMAGGDEMLPKQPKPAAAEKKPSANPKDKKAEPGNKHTININVGAKDGKK